VKVPYPPLQMATLSYHEEPCGYGTVPARAHTRTCEEYEKTLTFQHLEHANVTHGTVSGSSSILRRLSPTSSSGNSAHAYETAPSTVFPLQKCLSSSSEQCLHGSKWHIGVLHKQEQTLSLIYVNIKIVFNFLEILSIHNRPPGCVE